jgi:hypothetical protein
MTLDTMTLKFISVTLMLPSQQLIGFVRYNIRCDPYYNCIKINIPCNLQFQNII